MFFSGVFISIKNEVNFAFHQKSTTVTEKNTDFRSQICYFIAFSVYLILQEKVSGLHTGAVLKHRQDNPTILIPAGILSFARQSGI